MWPIHRDTSNSPSAERKITTLLLAFYYFFIFSPLLLTVAVWAPAKSELRLTLAAQLQGCAAGLPLPECSAAGSSSAASRAQQHPSSSAMQHGSPKKPDSGGGFLRHHLMPTGRLVPGLCYSSSSQNTQSLMPWASSLGFCSCLYFSSGCAFFSYWAGLCSQKSGNVSEWNTLVLFCKTAPWVAAPSERGKNEKSSCPPDLRRVWKCDH